MDPLTEICASLRVRRAMFTRIDAYAPWGWASSGELVVKFVLVVRGAGVLMLPTEPVPVALRGGDLFIMLDDTPYKMFDQSGSVLMDCIDVEKRRVGNYIRVGGDGALTTFVSGFFEISALEAKPLFSVLPNFLLLKSEESRTRAFESVLELLATETSQPGLGSEAMISRLFELLFIHAIRAYSSQYSAPKKGWLAAVVDRLLSEAIKEMHGNLANNWTLEALAKAAGMSRSAFASRFRSVVGQTPLEYLTEWRMHKATLLIQRNDLSLSEIAQDVGYHSEAAFNRIFKREVGTTPGAFRRDHSEQSPPAPLPL
ncbi:AraC-like DNA-binding protein [Rhizobium sp. BK313]|uniref:AraC family transcriptional regulator n=1 Tax=Rhizobium sp. BK313 TaxID=2587081 RepID=UPI0010F13898|nr:AraC family transcriptional regulator [Rhizobium sp. BK313]MBB3458297.1 AraC-like DNA-binding protein [Rhizobium sp. BK313]